jgi:hypothetical protein
VSYFQPHSILMFHQRKYFASNTYISWNIEAIARLRVGSGYVISSPRAQPIGRVPVMTEYSWNCVAQFLVGCLSNKKPLINLPDYYPMHHVSCARARWSLLFSSKFPQHTCNTMFSFIEMFVPGVSCINQCLICYTKTTTKMNSKLTLN